MTYREHLFRLEEERAPHARFLLLLNNVTLEGQPDRISALLLDTDVALRLLHESKREGAWKERVETAVTERAVVASPPRAEISSREDARAYLDTLVREHLQPVLEERGHWEPWGTVLLRTKTEEPLEILLDGKSVGATTPDETELVQISAGSHVVELSHPDFAPARATMEVRRADRVEVEIPLIRTADDPFVLRPILTWSGLLLAAAGGAIAIIAVVRADDEVKTACFDGSSCAHDGFLTFGYTTNASDPASVNPSGVLMAPLGYSLAATGATWSLGTLLFGDDHDIPWIQLVAGLAVGGGAYALSAALE